MCGSRCFSFSPSVASCCLVFLGHACMHVAKIHCFNHNRTIDTHVYACVCVHTWIARWLNHVHFILLCADAAKADVNVKSDKCCQYIHTCVLGGLHLVHFFLETIALIGRPFRSFNLKSTIVVIFFFFSFLRKKDIVSHFFFPVVFPLIQEWDKDDGRRNRWWFHLLTCRLHGGFFPPWNVHKSASGADYIGPCSRGKWWTILIFQEWISAGVYIGVADSLDHFIDGQTLEMTYRTCFWEDSPYTQ